MWKRQRTIEFIGPQNRIKTEVYFSKAMAVSFSTRINSFQREGIVRSFPADSRISFEDSQDWQGLVSFCSAVIEKTAKGADYLDVMPMVEVE